jgi:hypothetical protein
MLQAGADGGGRVSSTTTLHQIPIETQEQRVQRLLKTARTALFKQSASLPDYPIEALGELADAATAISSGTQTRPALAGQCVLATAALVTQSLANIRTLESIKPLSLYCISIADSGDGKSTAEREAMRPISAFQREQTELLRHNREAIAATPKGEEAPEAMRPPYRMTKDSTIEGIRSDFADGQPSQASFTSEAAAVLCGYGMNADNRLKTAGGYNGLWDDGEISVSRSLAGRIQLYDRRLTVHWLIQPDAARDAVNDPALTGVGFWPRFLLAWPEPPVPRLARPWRSDQSSVIADYWRRCDQLIRVPLGEDCSDLPILEPTAEAMNLAGRYFEKMEIAAKGDQATLGDIKPFAIRATEQAFRIAGVLAAFADRHEPTVADIRNGIALASYSLENWRGLFGDREEAMRRASAYRLLQWLSECRGQCASETAIIKNGPRALRSRHARDTALAILEQHGLVSSAGRLWSIADE